MNASWRRHAPGESTSILDLVERVKAAAVKYQIVWTTGDRVAQNIEDFETAIQLPSGELRRGFINPGWSNVDPEHRKALLGKPNRIGPRATADIEDPALSDNVGTQELDEMLIRLPRVPGRLAGNISLVPLMPCHILIVSIPEPRSAPEHIQEGCA